ncbi:hypothetical protein S349_9 [Shewanella sp. phage 3/49]|uniref:hypothetical protein n=1 Tax=Shewanella sp. phage 3/49 TaxID=1458863 RepID=UPI0004F7291F|nr:hypothetical protein S349_9 [Shewanella sp. phage 3/49]AHK11799.1 hypothetical protein S349_9 [Shewanella sp. phage 3/49]
MSEIKLKTLDILCGELCAAMLGDEHGNGVDIAGGMYGEETTIWIKSVASKMDKLTEQNKMLREALMITDAHCRMHLKIHSSENTIASVALEATK